MTVTDARSTPPVSRNPRTGASAPAPAASTPAQIAAVIAAAVAAAPAVAAGPASARAAWLDAIATALEAHADELAALADDETALGLPRLTGELAKTAANARFYGAQGAAKLWRGDVSEDIPGPPPATLRRANLPLGPVAVFGASNFPFQFGVVGHDVCSALAAGCPVVVKAHPAHPRLSQRIADLAIAALSQAGAPPGTYAFVHGFEAGLALVDSDSIEAVGFTGSQAGGMALVERAARRVRPIPVFAEMGTVNPVVVTPGAATRADIADGFVDSFTLGAGQFCTKPGLIFVPEASTLIDQIAAAVAQREGAWLLTEAIAQAYDSGVYHLVAAGAQPVAAGGLPERGFGAAPRVLQVALDQLTVGSALLEECFGPVALLATYAHVPQLLAALNRLQPSLAASIWAGPAPAADPDLPTLVDQLSRQVGRVVVDGWPTGVACSPAMHHGGPWPATSRPEATSVGGAALDRWTRPVAFQGVPDIALPAAAR